MYSQWQFEILKGDKHLKGLDFEEAEYFCNKLTKPFRITAIWVGQGAIGEFKASYTDEFNSLGVLVDRIIERIPNSKKVGYELKFKNSNKDN